MHTKVGTSLSKVPAVTLGFWIIKIAATTLGETGGDAVTMTLNLGYLIGTAVIFATVFVVAVAAQIAAKRFHPLLYWFVIVATTTGRHHAGGLRGPLPGQSAMSGGTSMLFILLMATLGLWYWSLGTVSVSTIVSPKAEMFYWATIMFSQTLEHGTGRLYGRHVRAWLRRQRWCSAPRWR